MSNDNATDHLDDDHTDDDDLRILREKAKAGDTAAKENADLRRRLALSEAGIPTGTALGKMFVKSYDGELEVDAIKAAAIEVGLLTADGDDTDDGKDPYAQGDDPAPPNTRVRDALNGNRGDTAVGTEDDLGPHPTKDALKAYHSRKGQIGAENARLEAIDKVIVAGANGDERVIFDEQRFMADASGYGHGADIEV